MPTPPAAAHWLEKSQRGDIGIIVIIGIIVVIIVIIVAIIIVAIVITVFLTIFIVLSWNARRHRAFEQ